ncbi:MAG: hypothetical protein NT159_17095 [Proteobacteria bacterium]|nr:hypothetical protein [Pseudomonadota bacterium]
MQTAIKNLILGAAMAVFVTKAMALTFSANLSASHTTDYFQFTLSADSAVTVVNTPTGTLGTSNSGVAITKSDQSTVVVSTGVTAGYSNGPYSLKAGSYYLKLSSDGATNSAGTMTSNLAISANPLANDAEPNDTAQTATPMSVNTNVTGHLGYFDSNSGASYDTSDYWAVSLPSDGYLTITLQKDATLTQAVADMTWDGHNPGDLLTAGTHYIQVHYSNGYGAYTLRADLTPVTSSTSTTTTTTTTTSTTTTTLATQPLSATITASGPLTNQTLTLQSIQIPANDLAGGVSLYVVAVFGNTVLTFGPSGWTTQILAYQSGISTVPSSVTLLSSLDLSGIVGVTFFLGYGNGSGESALSDMLAKQKFVQLYTITAATSGNASTNLQDLSLWNIYGTAQVQGAALLIGDQIAGDFNDSDKDGNPANVWSTGQTSDSTGFGWDIDWAVSKGTFTAPLTVLWNGCLPYSGPDSRFLLGRKNAGFTNKAFSPDPITPEIYIQGDWTGTNPSLVVGTSAGQSTRGPNVTQTMVPGNSYDYQAICGDFKVVWISQVASFYFNGIKIADIPYASGYGEAFGLAFRSMANPIKVNSFTVTQP